MNAERLDPTPHKVSSVFEFLLPVDTALLRVPKWVPLASFFGASLLILLFGHAAWNWHASALETSVKKDVAASVDAKIERLSDWLAERRRDAAALVNDTAFFGDVAATMAPGQLGADVDRRIEQRLRAVRDAHQYKDILVLDADGAVRARSSPEAPPPGVFGLKRAREAMSSGEMLLGDLHYDTRGGGKIFYCAVVAPIQAPGAGTTPLGAVLLRIDPVTKLFPILDAPLGPWESAETLFAREENGDIVYLKELRHLGAPPVTVRRPVTEPTLLAALAARGSATYYRLRVEREALRQHYVNQVEYANDSILLLDQAGRILDVNERALEVYGYGRAELLGADVGMLRSFTARDRIGELLDEWSEGGQIYETWHRCKDGSVMPVEVSGRAFRIEGQVFYQKIVRDITDRKKVEQELRRLNEALEQRVADRTMELEHANRELKAFSYTVAHDLQVPLRHVRGFLRIALEDLGAEMQADARVSVERAARAAHNMSDMIQALLEFSRVTRAELHLERVALDDLVSEVVAEFAPECARRTIEWRIGPLPAVIADRRLLRMVLSNLISNAIKFTRIRNAAVIEIGTQASPGNAQGKLVVFFVRDNGAGFDMASASRLFEPFQRLHFAKDFEGTGIGLATCRRLIERHGGRMWAESVVDAGAAFYVALPSRSSGPERPEDLRAA